jgi:hypothetical protein
MTTSQTPFLLEILNGDPIPPGKRAYFQERLRNRIYCLILEEFIQKSESENLTQKTLAHRVGKGADQINRWLSSPGNWTIDTISDLLIGISGSELELSISKIADQLPRNLCTLEWTNIKQLESTNAQSATVSIQITQAQPKIIPFLAPAVAVGTTIPHTYPYPIPQSEARNG